MNSKQLLEVISAMKIEVLGLLQKSDLTTDKKSKRIIGNINNMFDRLDLTIEDVMPIEIVESYSNGMKSAMYELEKAGLGAANNAALNLESQVHVAAISEVTDDLMLDLKSAMRTARKNTNNNIFKTLDEVKTGIQGGIIQGNTRKEITKSVSKAFAENGMTSFITSDGKELPLDFYSQVVVRTNLKKANVNGSVNQYLDEGADLITISGHTPTCSHCYNYRGVTFSLSGTDERFPSAKGDLPPYHPNCMCSVQPVVEKYMTDQELEDAIKASEGFNSNADIRSDEMKEAYKKDQALKRQRNEEKKQFAKIKTELGDNAPKTLGGFRRMKGANSLAYKDLMHRYKNVTIADVAGGPKLKTVIPRQLKTKFRDEFVTHEARVAYRKETHLIDEQITLAKNKTVEEIRARPQFLKTHEEAENWIIKNVMRDGERPNIKDLDIEMVSLYSEIFNETSKDYPFLKNTYLNFGSTGEASGGLMNANGGIKFGHNKLEDLVDSGINGIASGFTTGDNIHDLMVHEIGHVVDNRLVLSGYDPNKPHDLINKFNEEKGEFMADKQIDFIKVKKAAYDFDNDTIEIYKNKLSEYAYTNESEYFAEAFSAYRAGDKRKDVKDFGAWFEKMVKMELDGKNKR